MGGAFERRSVPRNGASTQDFDVGRGALNERLNEAGQELRAILVAEIMQRRQHCRIQYGGA